MLTISKADLFTFAESLIKSPVRVIAPVAVNECFLYKKIEHVADMCLDFDETLYSPKHFLFPPKDVIMTYGMDTQTAYEPVFSENRQVIFGVHPCDCAAIALLDRVFTQGKFDAHYCNTRQKTIIIGIYPTKQSRFGFTKSITMGQDAYFSADAFLVDISESTYVIELVTDLGKEFFSNSNAIIADRESVALAEHKKAKTFDGITHSKSRDELPTFLHGKENHPVWEKRGKDCFMCGSCDLVCPTSFSFSLFNEPDNSLEYGVRYRKWDSAMTPSFNAALQTSAGQKLRSRHYAKQKHLFEKYGFSGCVGCGRCKKACLTDIAFPPDINKDLEETRV